MKKILSIVLVAVMVLAMVSCGKGEEMTLSFAFGDRTGTYSGDVNEEGLPDGQGTFISANEAGEKWTYTGSFVNGHFEGEGKTTYANGTVEVGTYHNDYIQPITQDELKAAFNDPDAYANHYADMVVSVFNVLGEDDGVYIFQAWQDIENYENNVLIGINNCDIQLTDDDYVRVRGYINGSYRYENAFGGETECMNFTAVEYELVSYSEAISPTTRTVVVNQTLSQHGYEVTVDKVEFSKLETRVFVTVVNNGSDVFNLWDYSAVVEQGGRQYDCDWGHSDTPDVQSDLRPGNMSDGVIVFPALAESDFSFIVDGYSDNWSEDINDYIFNITVQ